MFPVLFLTVCFAVAMGMPEGPPGHRGPPMFIKVQQCCKKELVKPKEKDDKEMLKECFQGIMKPPSCATDICIGLKTGVASADGTIDKEALTERLETDFANNADALDAIMENCVNGDLSKFGPEDFCELMKMNKCIEVQTVKSCDEWKDDDDCAKLQGMAKKMLERFQ